MKESTGKEITKNKDLLVSPNMTCPICNCIDSRPLFKKRELKLLRCRKCGLVYIDNLLDKFNLDKYSYYKERINLSKLQLYNPLTERRYIGLLNRIQGYRKNNEILEIGCGEGHFLSVAKNMDWQVMGLEKAPYAAEICKKFKINVICSDLLDTDIKNDYYDAVVMFEVLEHLTQPQEYLRKINAILRKGGVLVITTPNFNSITRRLLNQRWRLINEEHLLYFTPNTLKSTLGNCNFRLLGFEAKHITLPELFGLSRGNTDNIYRQNQKIRKAIENNKFLSFSKKTINKFLSLTKLGESIECICQKI